MKVLGFYTLDVHELTHHLDFMSTPFGINFHQKPLFEFLVFQNFSANLLLHPEYLVGGNRLQDFHALLAKIGYNPKLFYLWKQIRKRSMVFDAYFNQVKDTIGYGW